MTAIQKYKALLAKYPLIESDFDENGYPKEEAAQRAAVWVFEQMADGERNA